MVPRWAAAIAVLSCPLLTLLLHQDKRGNWHALFHAESPSGAPWGRSGGHGCSKDGIHWTYTGTAFTTTANFTDGSSVVFSRRERPHLVFSDSSTPHTPTHLTSGVQWGTHDQTFTLIQPINMRQMKRRNILKADDEGTENDGRAPVGGRAHPAASIVRKYPAPSRCPQGHSCPPSADFALSMDAFSFAVPSALIAGNGDLGLVLGTSTRGPGWTFGLGKNIEKTRNPL